MTRFYSCAFVCCFLFLLWGTEGFGSTSFDERLWEKYAEIVISPISGNGNLAGVYIDPQKLGSINSKAPFADLRVVTERKEEVAWQIVERRPKKQQEEIPHQISNLSLTEKGETWLELLVDKPGAGVNAVDVITPDTDFSRQIQVLGSPDGKKWNLIRKDGVIFDITKMEKLRHTRITFPSINFQHVALKINNATAQPLTINNIKVLRERVLQAQTYTIQGMAEKPALDASHKENSIVVHMSIVFPLDRLIIATTERNFQRSVEVQIKKDTEWVHWAQGMIFSFDTATMHESQLAIDMPVVAAKEFRLVFKNLDSPPLSVNNVNGIGYRRLLIFKQQADRKMYLFWGNPLAQQPQYDLSEIIAKQNLDQLPIAHLGQAHTNSAFAGDKARLPFTERYKYLLYILVTIGIAGLVFLQYRVFRKVSSD
ncbi:MAG: DUF3999 family protein [Smithella sp.]